MSTACRGRGLTGVRLGGRIRGRPARAHVAGASTAAKGRLRKTGLRIVSGSKAIIRR